MTKRSGWKTIYVVLILCASVSVSAQTFSTLANFDGRDGAVASAPLVQGLDGNLYGTTLQGGLNGPCDGYLNGCGNVFKVTPSGQLTSLYTFCSLPNCADGWSPNGLVQATNGNLYGTATYGGSNSCAEPGCGTLFEITPRGDLTTLYDFCTQSDCADGGAPYSGLVQAVNGKLYGTTEFGGNYDAGAIFEITPLGKLTRIYSFCSQPGCADGEAPVAPLTQADNGSFYGTTPYGGVANCRPFGCGTIFEITRDGKLTTLYMFCSQNGSACADGAIPEAGLVQATDGNLYGTTAFGGSNNGGTVFRIALTGALTTLYSFCSQPNCADGSYPPAGLVQATNGRLYGVTYYGGANGNGCDAIGCGTVFEITLAGQLTTLHTFCSSPECADGEYPVGGLVQATNGTLYATASGGGLDSAGTVFALSGLAPFVKTLPAAGKIGAQVGILGNNLTAATSVTFNRTSAQFTAKSPTLIVAHVPTGATTGTVQVTLPSGTLSSNVPFFILQ